MRCSLRFFAFGLIGLLLGAFFLFFHRLGDRDLWSSHEARAAQDAQRILQEGCWGLPRLYDDQLELQKPPLYYWLVAIVSKFRGGTVDAWSERLPAAVAGLFGVLGMYFFLAWRGRPVAGLIAATVLATATQYSWLARVGRIDMPLTLTVAIALGAFYLAQERGFLWRLLGYLAIAAGIMLKGPIGAVLPMLVLGVHRLLEWQTGGLRERQGDKETGHSTALSPCLLVSLSRNWWGIPLILLLTVPWYWWANQQSHGEFFRVFFWHHNIERGLGGDDASGGMHARPWYLYAGYLAGEWLPWTPLLLLALWYFGRQGRWRHDAEARFGLVWLGAIVLMLSCLSFKRADYLLPAWPGAALVLGCAMEQWWRDARRPTWLLAGWATTIAATLAGWGVYIEHVLPAREYEREQITFAAAVRREVPAPRPVLFFRAEDHALAFHLGRPLNTFREWENLDTWTGRPGCHYILMPAACADQWPAHVTAGRLEEVLRNTNLPGGKRRRGLVLMRTRPHSIKCAFSDASEKRNGLRASPKPR